MIPRWRSLLFAPADDARLCGKAVRSGADAVILDLEDGVAAAAKAGARAELPAVIAEAASGATDVIVRINAGWGAAFADLDAAIRAGVAAIMVPKVEDGARLRVIGEMIAEREDARGLSAGTIDIVALVESPAALFRLEEIAAAPRVAAIALGSEDFSASFGVAPGRESLLHPCRLVALAAAAHGRAAIAVPVSLAAFRDEGAFADACDQARGFGTTGALCIHPRQVTIANRVFSPDAAVLAQARAVLDAWDTAQAEGRGICAVDGRMIDRPVAERARKLLATE